MLTLTREILREEVSNLEEIMVYFEKDRLNSSSFMIRLFKHEGKQYISWFEKAAEITNEMYNELTAMVIKCSYQNIIVWNNEFDTFAKKYKTDLGI